MKAVRFDQYGGIGVLDVRDVPEPEPGPGQLLVRVKAAGINPGEAKIRDGLLHDRWPATFPSGQGSDFAGIIESAGPGVTSLRTGQEVIGWVDTRSSHAEYVLAEAANLIPKPEGISWEAAGALPVAGFTAWAAVRAVGVADGDVVVVSGASGGVGTIAVQLARRAGAARVWGLTREANAEWHMMHGVLPVPYDDGWTQKVMSLDPKRHVDAFIDTYGGDYVQLALGDLGVAPARVDTIVAFDAVATHGVKAEGNTAGASAATLAELAGLVAEAELDIPIAASYPLAQVQDAFRELAGGHLLGKIVLLP